MLDELFLIPALVGLLLAISLPLLGCYLRLREEWLAALAYTHVAAAGGLLAAVLGGSPLVGGMVLAGMAGWGKRFAVRRWSGSAAQVLLLLAGWATTVLLAANHPLIERLGQALFDGQLYFADGQQLTGLMLATVLGLFALRRLSPHLLRAHIYPDLAGRQGSGGGNRQLHFDVLAGLWLALATLNMGLMAAFALVFVPPWLAFRRGRDWRQGLRWAVGLGVAAYGLAFALALGFDQPFGPVLAWVLVVFALIF